MKRDRNKGRQKPNVMNTKIEVVCADPTVGRKYLAALERCCLPREVHFVTRTADARLMQGRSKPLAVLLDESAVQTGEVSLVSAAAKIAELAPVVVVAAANEQPALAFLLASGIADFVVRSGHFASIAAGLIEHRLNSMDSSGPSPARSEPISEDFGEILRHEVNNPLTGILGNAELLLSRPEGLPTAAITRVETIAELAVRLRETVRRLSSALAVHNHHGGS